MGFGIRVPVMTTSEVPSIDSRLASKLSPKEHIGKEIGLDSDSVKILVDSDFGAREILAEEDQARVERVNGVPRFFYQRVPITSGAHKAQVLASVLREALKPASQRCSARRQYVQLGTPVLPKWPRLESSPD